MTPLYRRLLGSRFDDLPARVRALHDFDAVVRWHGRADVERGGGALVRGVCGLLRLPPAGRDQSLTVMFEPVGDGERWTRLFGSRRFVSVQRAGAGMLLEDIGPVTLQMAVTASADGISLTMIAARFLGLRLPFFLVPRITTREWQAEGRYHFDVAAVLPGLGPVVRYRGWLEPEAR